MVDEAQSHTRIGGVGSGLSRLETRGEHRFSAANARHLLPEVWVLRDSGRHVRRKVSTGTEGRTHDARSSREGNRNLEEVQPPNSYSSGGNDASMTKA